MKLINVLSVGFVFLLSACSSVKLVNAPTHGKSQAGPINEKSRPGVVKYCLEGDGEDVEQRRQEAYELMSESCGGDYKIVSEDVMKEGKLVRTGGDRGIGESEDLEMYIKFACTR